MIIPFASFSSFSFFAAAAAFAAADRALGAGAGFSGADLALVEAMRAAAIIGFGGGTGADVAAAAGAGGAAVAAGAGVGEAAVLRRLDRRRPSAGASVEATEDAAGVATAAAAAVTFPMTGPGAVAEVVTGAVFGETRGVVLDAVEVLTPVTGVCAAADGFN